MLRIFITVALSTLSTAASAHVGVGDTVSFVHGFSHPLGGIDHILAMVAVGLLAARLGGRALWLVPLSFVSVMTLAGVVGILGLPLSYVEIGIGMSIVALGVIITFELNPSVLVAMALVGFFAIFHGHAHGAEMPESVSGLEYGVGFVCATMLLHAIGIGIGLAIAQIGKKFGRFVIQVGGAAMSLAGVALLVKIF